MELCQITKYEINIDHIDKIQFRFNIYHFHRYFNIFVGVWLVGCMSRLMGVRLVIDLKSLWVVRTTLDTRRPPGHDACDTGMTQRQHACHLGNQKKETTLQETTFINILRILDSIQLKTG